MPFGCWHSLLGASFPAAAFGLSCVGLTALRQTASGFPRSAPVRCDRGGCPLCSGAMVSVTHPREEVCPLVCTKRRVHTVGPLRRLCQPTSDARLITKRKQGFTHVHPSGLSLACGSPLGLVRSWAFPLCFTPRRCRRRRERREQAFGHSPESSLSSAPLNRSDLVSHSRYQRLADSSCD